MWCYVTPNWTRTEQHSVTFLYPHVSSGRDHRPKAPAFDLSSILLSSSIRPFGKNSFGPEYMYGIYADIWGILLVYLGYIDGKSNGLSISKSSNHVLLVKIEGPEYGIPSIIYYLVLYTIVKGVCYKLLVINQPMGIWDIYASVFSLRIWGLCFSTASALAWSSHFRLAERFMRNHLRIECLLTLPPSHK